MAGNWLDVDIPDWLKPISPGKAQEIALQDASRIGSDLRAASLKREEMAQQQSQFEQAQQLNYEKFQFENHVQNERLNLDRERLQTEKALHDIQVKGLEFQLKDAPLLTLHMGALAKLNTSQDVMKYDPGSFSHPESLHKFEDFRIKYAQRLESLEKDSVAYQSRQAMIKEAASWAGTDAAISATTLSLLANVDGFKIDPETLNAFNTAANKIAELKKAKEDDKGRLDSFSVQKVWEDLKSPFQKKDREGIIKVLEWHGATKDPNFKGIYEMAKRPGSEDTTKSGFWDLFSSKFWTGKGNNAPPSNVFQGGPFVPGPNGGVIFDPSKVQPTQ